MADRRAPVLPGQLAATVPLAPALLVRERTLWYWRVVRCPWCRRTHHHGGGHKAQDPRAFLGPRYSHCGAPQARQYLLIDSGEVVSRARRRTRSEAAR